MIIEETNLKGCYILKPKIFVDNRGSFFESFNKKEFESKTGLEINFVQHNQSISKKGALRGLHIQKGEHSQAKLVRVIKGKVLDIAVDVRNGSSTFGKHFSIELSAENNKQLFVPRGFLHGFSVLEDDTILEYKCDNFYNKASEDGVLYNDDTLNIDWKLNEREILLSEKDKELKTFKEFINA